MRACFHAFKPLQYELINFVGGQSEPRKSLLKTSMAKGRGSFVTYLIIGTNNNQPFAHPPVPSPNVFSLLQLPCLAYPSSNFFLLQFTLFLILILSSSSVLLPSHLLFSLLFLLLLASLILLFCA